MDRKKSAHVKGENIIVAIIAIALITYVLTFIGFHNAKEWLFSPINWNDPDGFSITLSEKKEYQSYMELTFLISNDTETDVSRGKFYAIIDGNYLGVSFDRLRPFSSAQAKSSFAESGSAGGFFEAIHGKQPDEINLKYHFSYLLNADAENNGDYAFKANSWLKPLLLLVISGLLCILGISGVVKFLPLRIVLKIVGIPALLIVFIIMMAAGSPNLGSGAENTGHDAAESARERRSSEEYKRQANIKAGAIMRGKTEDAARAQAQMDKAMAEMIGGNSRSVQRYKQAANHKAGAIMTGRPEDAARAQAQMDKAMSDMVRDAKSEK